MATVKWRGSAKAIAQVTTITFSAYTSGQTYTLTINGKDVAFTATASTIDNVVTGLIAAIAATTELEFQEFTATSSSGLVLTGSTAGVPFTVAASATGGITPTITATANATGPNFFDNADNWEGGSLPGAGDDLVFEESTVALLYALVSTTNYGDITIDSTYSGTIGLPSENAAGYREYRPRFLKLGDGTSAFAVTIGQGTGRQSSRILIDGNDATITAAIYNTGNSQFEEYPVTIKNTDSSSTFDIYAGQVQIDADTSGAASAVRLTPAGGNAGVRVLAADTVACGAVTATGGQLEIRGGATSVNAFNGAQVVFANAATCPTVSVDTGATIFWASTAGITTKLNVFTTGTIDFTRNAAAKAVQACDIYTGGIIRDTVGIITWTSGIILQGARLQEVQMDIGRSRTITPS